MTPLLDLAERTRELWDTVCNQYVHVVAAAGEHDGEEAANALRFTTYLLAVHIAGADGPINRLESAIITAATGQDNSYGAHERLRQQLLSDPTLVDSATTVLRVAVQRCATFSHVMGDGYDPGADGIILTLETLGQTVIAADYETDRLEVKMLSRLTSALREHAEEVHRLLSERNDAGGTVPPRAPAAAAGRDLQHCLADLHALVGLGGVKEEVETLSNLAKVFHLRKQKGLPVPDLSFHLVFTGNPGTGKTTVARLISQIYGHLGLLSKGHLVEVDRSGLVASYVGQTAAKVRQVLEEARGGILFIDEAYSLSSGGDQDYGREAIETLLKGMEDYRDDLVVIVAGYGDKMEGFLQSNPGLRSRFARAIDFPDYDNADLSEIFLRMAARSGYQLSPAALDAIPAMVAQKWTVRSASFANARDVRNVFETAIAEHANRLAMSPSFTDEALTTLEEADIVAAFRPEYQGNVVRIARPQVANAAF